MGLTLLTILAIASMMIAAIALSQVHALRNELKKLSRRGEPWFAGTWQPAVDVGPSRGRSHIPLAEPCLRHSRSACGLDRPDLPASTARACRSLGHCGGGGNVVRASEYVGASLLPSSGSWYQSPRAGAVLTLPHRRVAERMVRAVLVKSVDFAWALETST